MPEAQPVGSIADRLALLELEAQYARRWDLGDAGGWAALFEPHGIFELAPASAPSQRFEGRQALTRFCAETTLRYRGVHVLGAPALSISEDRATAYVAFHWIGFGNESGAHSAHRHTSGYYDVEYRKAGGEWFLSNRRERPIAGTISESFGF